MNEKITAYVLNEMPPDERAVFEAELNQDASLRTQVEEMQSFCILLHDNVSAGGDTATNAATDQETTFTSEQRDAVISAFKDNKPDNVVRPSFWRHPFLMSGAAIAACLTVMILVNLDRVERPEMSVMAQAQEAATEGAESKEANAINEARQAELGMLKQQAADIKKDIADAEVARSEEIASSLVLAKPAEPAGGNMPMPAPASAPSQQPAAMSSPLAKNKAESGSSSINESEIKMEPLAPSQSIPGLRQKDVDTHQDALAGSVMSQKMDDVVGGGIVHDLPSAVFDVPHAHDSHGVRSPAPVTSRSAEHYNLTARNDQRVRMMKEVNRTWEYPAVSSNESYTQISENTFKTPSAEPLSTFSIDVDTASYANVRRFLNDGLRPPADAVRLEELVNYFPYSYEPPTDGKPFSVTVDMAEAPWQPLHRLARVAIKGREIHGERGPANFVFLVDVSGSMNSRDKLPLVIQSLRMLVDQIRADDRVSLVTYAGDSRVVLESTPSAQKEKILNGINGLQAGGSTHGSSGIRMAYEQAVANFQKDGVNRVILCTDGDFNVGISSPEELEKLITEKAKSKVFLSVLGYGTGNLKDRTMETLADKGNGNYAYIDSVSEARKVLVEQMTGTLITIAKDVKIQVEFNPAHVAAYRLIGYENRTLAKEDFNNDQKDAGEIGAGHTVTALYEIVPAGLKYPNGRPVVDELKYSQTTPAQPKPADTVVSPDQAVAPADAAESAEIMTVKLRYKAPEGDVSSLIEIPVTDSGEKLSDVDQEFQFATSVAGFGMLLRKSPNANSLTWDQVRELAQKGKGSDTQGYRGEFLQLIEKARGLD